MLSTKVAAAERVLGDEGKYDQYLLMFKALGGLPTLYFGFVFGMAGNLYGNLCSFAMNCYNSTPKRMFMRTV